MKSKIFILAVIILASCEKSNFIVEPVLDGTWQYYSVNDGLSDNRVKVLYEDSQGKIWAGTDNEGLCFLNGDTWTHVWNDKLPASCMITSFVEDNSGSFWIAADAGLFRNNGSSWTEILDNYGYSIGAKALLSASDGKMWISDYGFGFHVYYGGTLHSYDFPGTEMNYVNSMIEDTSMNIWFASDTGAIRLNPDFSYKLFTTRSGLPSSIVNTIFEDSFGDIWFGCYGPSSVSCLHGTSMRRIALNNGYFGEAVRSFSEDDAHNLWIGSLGSALIRYDGTLMRKILDNPDLVKTGVWCSMIDHNKRLWLGTSNGIFVYSPKSDLK